MYLLKLWHRDFAGDALQGWENKAPDQLEKMFEEEDRAFITPLIKKLVKHMNEMKLEPQMPELPKGYVTEKVKTSDGNVQEVVEYEDYEVLKIPHYLDLTLEDVKAIVEVMSKTGVGRYSQIKLLNVWYLGYNEE